MGLVGPTFGGHSGGCRWNLMPSTSDRGAVIEAQRKHFNGDWSFEKLMISEF